MYPVLLTFDLEYWFESLSIQKHLTGNETDNLSVFIERILKLLAKNNSQATFFVTGKVLDKEPDLIQSIYDAGHEIAVHSLDYQPLWNKSLEAFDAEIKEISTKIEKLTGYVPIGHRAASFSLNHNTKWALKILAENNFKYDSSIFPFKHSPILLPFFKNSLYGIKSRLFTQYKINLNNPIEIDSDSALIEFPISVFHCGKFKLPITGGIYIRMIPWPVFKSLLKIKLKKELACIHFHPFDFVNKIPSIEMPWLKKFIKYYNTKNTWKKLEYIIKEFECVSIEKFIYKNQYK